MSPSDAFAAALDFVLKREGGYHIDPIDPGGETSFGISKRAYPGLDIKALTRDKAASIYFTDYWCKAGCPTLPAPVALVGFDAAVNAGVSAAASMFKDARAAVGSDPAALATEFTARRLVRYGENPHFDRY